MPIVITRSNSFLTDLEELAESVFQHALNNDEDPVSAETYFKDTLKNELIRVVGLIQLKPFTYQAYSSSNPTRRAVIYHDNLILEYLLVPYSATQSSQVTEIILSALIPSRSGKFNGAYDDIDTFDFDDNFE